MVSGQSSASIRRSSDVVATGCVVDWGGVLLLLVGLLGAAARSAVAGRTGQISPAGTAAAGVVVAVAALATLTAVLLLPRRLRRRGRPDEPQHGVEIPQSRWANLAALVVALAVIATLLALGLEILRHHSAGRSSSTAASPTGLVTPTSSTQHHHSDGSGLGAVDGLVLGGVALLAVAGALYLRRHGTGEASTANRGVQSLHPQRRLEASVRAGGAINIAVALLGVVAAGVLIVSMSWLYP